MKPRTDISNRKRVDWEEIYYRLPDKYCYIHEDYNGSWPEGRFFIRTGTAHLEGRPYGVYVKRPLHIHTELEDENG